jgi:hypothetical protein
VPDDGNSDFEFYPETKHQSSYSFGFWKSRKFLDQL